MNGDDGEEGGDAPKKVKRELWRSEDQGLAADYEYVMYGKVSPSLSSLIAVQSSLLGQKRREEAELTLGVQVYKFDDSLGGDNAT